MAKVVEKKNNLAGNKNKVTLAYWIGYALAWIGGILFIEVGYMEIPQFAAWLIGILGFLGAVTVHLTRDKKGVYEGGVKGEKDALRFLENNLPDSYSVITNAVIYFENRQNELDFVVVGPTGIFTVEVKNYSGEIYGSYFDKMLTKKKGKYTEEINNPVFQARTQVDILAKYLKASGIRCWVNGTVLKVHPKGGVNLPDMPTKDIPFFAVATNGKEQLLQYIQNSSRNNLSAEDIQRIVEAI